MTSNTFQRSCLLLLVAFISVVFVWMIRDFLIPLLLAAIFASLARPLYLQFHRWTKGRAHLSSGLTLIVFVLVIVVPLIGFFGLVTKEAIRVTETVTPWVQERMANRDRLNQTLQHVPGFKYLAPYSEAILNRTGEAVSGLGNLIFKRASAITAGTILALVHFAIMLYAMFFFMVDGPAMLKKILYYLPLKASDENTLMERFQSMSRATVKGLVVIGAVQGTLGGLALGVAGVPSALFWGTVMALFSMIPNVGSAIVWVPACVYLFIKGQTVASVMVFLWCALVVGTADNILRPLLVGKDTEMPELMVFISTLGGLALFGLPGFILGPVTAVLFITVWDIYGDTFKDVLPRL